MFNRKILALVIGGCVGASAVQAQSTGYVGGLLGAASVTKGGGTGFAFGVDAGMFASEDIAVGAYFDYRKKDGAKIMPFGIEANYMLKSVTPGLFVGVKTGFVTSDINTAYSLGAQAGYDYSIASDVTIGAELGYNFVCSKGLVASYAVISYLASVKYWF